MKDKVIKNYAEMFFQLTKRHLLVFFRNKIRVFFTLMVPFIVFIVYVFFLRDMELNTVKNILTEKEIEFGKEAGLLTGNQQLMHYIKALVDSWMLSGILAISTMTVSLQTNTMIVTDKESGVNRDFASSPVGRNMLIGSYFLYNIVVTIAICFIFLLVCFIYLACLGEFCINFVSFLTIVAMLVFSSICSVLFTVFLCSFIKREATMASVTTLLSTAIGFLIGAYLPLAMMPNWAQNVCIFVPGTFSCSLMRYSMMSAPINQLKDYVATLGLGDVEMLLNELTVSFGYNVKFFSFDVNPGMQAVGQTLLIIVLFVANVLSGKYLVTVLGGMTKKIKLKKQSGVKTESGVENTVETDIAAKEEIPNAESVTDEKDIE